MKDASAVAIRGRIDRRKLATIPKVPPQTSTVAEQFLDEYVSLGIDLLKGGGGGGGGGVQRTARNDMQLACDGRVEANLYRSYWDQVSCVCDSSSLVIICLSLESLASSKQVYNVWYFDSNTGAFSALSVCSVCATDYCDVSSGYCMELGYSYSYEAPYACRVGYQKDNFYPTCWETGTATTGGGFCQICSAGNGQYGVYSNCFTSTTGTDCITAPQFTNPFLALRAAESSSSSTQTSNAGGDDPDGASIAGSIIAVVAFVAIGAAIYYYLRKRFPDQQEEEGNGDTGTTKQSPPVDSTKSTDDLSTHDAASPDQPEVEENAVTSTTNSSPPLIGTETTVDSSTNHDECPSSNSN
ncbi:hypothetical protein ACA910_010402 [Epithemia clementina (nom. ined.)]